MFSYRHYSHVVCSHQVIFEWLTNGRCICWTGYNNVTLFNNLRNSVTQIVSSLQIFFFFCYVGKNGFNEVHVEANFTSTSNESWALSGTSQTRRFTIHALHNNLWHIKLKLTLGSNQKQCFHLILAFVITLFKIEDLCKSGGDCVLLIVCVLSSLWHKGTSAGGQITGRLVRSKWQAL